jgi:hypothetical protein
MAFAFMPLATTTNAAFFAIFGLFMVAMVVLIVIIIVWAVRHDVAGRAAWRQRQDARQNGHEPPPPRSAS